MRSTEVAVTMCRVQSGIDVDQSTARLIEAAWPDLVRIGRRVDAKDPKGAARELAREMVLAVPKYDFGDRGQAEPIWWLLTGRRSAVRLAARDMIRKRQAYNQRHTGLPDDDNLLGASPGPHESEGPVALSVAAWAFVEDGVTLSTYEYRVLTYLVDHAQPYKQAIQRELATRMGVTRARITRLYHLAIVRILCAMGETEAYFKAKGVALPAWADVRRHAWAQHVCPKPHILTAAQLAEVVGTLERTPLSESEIAWAYGIADPRVIRKARRAFADASVDPTDRRRP